MPTASKPAVLLIAHGSPDRVEDIPEFLRNISGGRPMPEAVVKEVQHRYGLIGKSPLREFTEKQGESLSRELGIPVYIGMRNWKPFLAEAVEQMKAAGITDCVAICLAPQNSRTSVGLYRKALFGEDSQLPFSVKFVESWHDHPLLIEAFTEKFLDRWKPLCTEIATAVPVIFTAHSVPTRTITEGDPYEAQARETATLVAKTAELGSGAWTFAFQSQGMSGGEWLGPTVEDTIVRLKQKGASTLFIQPIGFLCDHVEVLYDIDIGFQKFASEHGVRLVRAESLNDSPTLTEALADLARTHLKLGEGLSHA